jgi:hypothetical protein
VLAAARFWQFASRLSSLAAPYPWVGNLETWPSHALRRLMAAYKLSFDQWESKGLTGPPVLQSLTQILVTVE